MLNFKALGLEIWPGIIAVWWHVAFGGQIGGVCGRGCGCARPLSVVWNFRWCLLSRELLAGLLSNIKPRYGRSTIET